MSGRGVQLGKANGQTIGNEAADRLAAHHALQRVRAHAERSRRGLCAMFAHQIRKTISCTEIESSETVLTNERAGMMQRHIRIMATSYALHISLPTPSNAGERIPTMVVGGYRLDYQPEIGLTALFAFVADQDAARKAAAT